MSMSLGVRLKIAPPPSLADKLRRALWGAIWLLLFRPTPVPLHGWRRLLLRMFGAKVGAGAAIYPSALVWAPWNVSIGANATVGGGADIYAVGRCMIGDHAIISQRAFLCGASHNIQSPTFDLVVGDIEVGANAWVAAEAFVGPGVKIGEGAVVAARAVAIRDVPEWLVVGGNPARTIGRRPAEARNLLRHA
jgi:putative colanic acid biosynthesis acetyltransferase WcaF